MRASQLCRHAPGAAALGAATVLASIFASAAITGCTASAEDVRAPQDRLFSPTGLVVAPDDKVLFVANGNSDRRYDSGSISVVDLGAVEAALAPWLECLNNPQIGDPRSCSPSAGCSQDLDHLETLVCDASQFLRRDAGVRIGNFASELAIQDFSSGGVTRARVFAPTRGDPSITWADFDGNSLRCTAASGGYAQCDDPHRLTLVQNDPDLGIPDEPFSVFADSRNGFAVVTHLASSAVTLINAPADSDAVEIVDLVVGTFITLISGASTASAVSGRDPGGATDTIYVGSTLENKIQTFTVGRRDNAAAFLLPGNFFLLNAVGNEAGNSGDTRSIKFSPTGDRMYVANRLPPSLQIYNTAMSPTGVPLNAPTGSSDICREASSVAVVDLGMDFGERAYVTCFQDGQIYVVDPAGQSQVEDIITVGRGPYAVIASHTTHRLFVSNFLEDTIAVIDIAPDALDSLKRNRTRNRVVLRIGIPRAP